MYISIYIYICIYAYIHTYLNLLSHLKYHHLVLKVLQPDLYLSIYFFSISRFVF